MLGGALAEICFELYAWLLSPVLFGLELQPSRLVMALANKFAGLELSYAAAFVIHALIGTVIFGFFILILTKIIRLNIFLTGSIGGVALWFFSQGVLAPAIGREFMMGFGAYTQSSFVAHVGMAIIIAYIVSLAPQSLNQPLVERQEH